MEIKAKSINRPYGTYYLSFLFDFLNVFFSNHRIRRRMKKKMSQRIDRIKIITNYIWCHGIWMNNNNKIKKRKRNVATKDKKRKKKRKKTTNENNMLGASTWRHSWGGHDVTTEAGMTSSRVGCKLTEKTLIKR